MRNSSNQRRLGQIIGKQPVNFVTTPRLRSTAKDTAASVGLGFASRYFPILAEIVPGELTILCIDPITRADVSRTVEISTALSATVVSEINAEFSAGEVVAELINGYLYLTAQATGEGAYIEVADTEVARALGFPVGGDGRARVCSGDLADNVSGVSEYTTGNLLAGYLNPLNADDLNRAVVGVSAEVEKLQIRTETVEPIELGADVNLAESGPTYYAALDPDTLVYNGFGSDIIAPYPDLPLENIPASFFNIGKVYQLPLDASTQVGYDPIYGEDGRVVRVVGMTAGAPVEGWMTTESEEPGDGKSLYKVDRLKASRSIIDIDPSGVLTLDSSIESAGIVPGDRVVISEATNLNPHSNNGEYTVVSVVSATKIQIKPVRASTVLALNVQKESGEVFGTVRVSTGSFVSGVTLVFDPPIPESISAATVIFYGQKLPDVVPPEYEVAVRAFPVTPPDVATEILKIKGPNAAATGAWRALPNQLSTAPMQLIEDTGDPSLNLEDLQNRLNMTGALYGAARPPSSSTNTMRDPGRFLRALNRGFISELQGGRAPASVTVKSSGNSVDMVKVGIDGLWQVTVNDLTGALDLTDVGSTIRVWKASGSSGFTQSRSVTFVIVRLLGQRTAECVLANGGSFDTDLYYGATLNGQTDKWELCNGSNITSYDIALNLIRLGRTESSQANYRAAPMQYASAVLTRAGRGANSLWLKQYNKQDVTAVPVVATITGDSSTVTFAVSGTVRSGLIYEESTGRYPVVELFGTGGASSGNESADGFYYLTNTASSGSNMTAQLVPLRTLNVRQGLSSQVRTFATGSAGACLAKFYQVAAADHAPISNGIFSQTHLNSRPNTEETLLKYTLTVVGDDGSAALGVTGMGEDGIHAIAPGPVPGFAGGSAIKALTVGGGRVDNRDSDQVSTAGVFAATIGSEAAIVGANAPLTQTNDSRQTLAEFITDFPTIDRGWQKAGILAVSTKDILVAFAQRGLRLSTGPSQDEYLSARDIRGGLNIGRALTTEFRGGSRDGTFKLGQEGYQRFTLSQGSGILELEPPFESCDIAGYSGFFTIDPASPSYSYITGLGLSDGEIRVSGFVGLLLVVPGGDLTNTSGAGPVSPSTEVDKIHTILGLCRSGSTYYFLVSGGTPGLFNYTDSRRRQAYTVGGRFTRSHLDIADFMRIGTKWGKSERSYSVGGTDYALTSGVTLFSPVNETTKEGPGFALWPGGGFNNAKEWSAIGGAKKSPIVRDFNLPGMDVQDAADEPNKFQFSPDFDTKVPEVEPYQPSGSASALPGMGASMSPSVLPGYGLQGSGSASNAKRPALTFHAPFVGGVLQRDPEKGFVSRRILNAFSRIAEDAETSPIDGFNPSTYPLLSDWIPLRVDEPDEGQTGFFSLSGERQFNYFENLGLSYRSVRALDGTCALNALLSPPQTLPTSEVTVRVSLNIILSTDGSGSSVVGTGIFLYDSDKLQTRLGNSFSGVTWGTTSERTPLRTLIGLISPDNVKRIPHGSGDPGGVVALSIDGETVPASGIAFVTAAFEKRIQVSADFTLTTGADSVTAQQQIQEASDNLRSSLKRIGCGFFLVSGDTTGGTYLAAEIEKFSLEVVPTTLHAGNLVVAGVTQAARFGFLTQQTGVEVVTPLDFTAENLHGTPDNSATASNLAILSDTKLEADKLFAGVRLRPANFSGTGKEFILPTPIIPINASGDAFSMGASGSDSFPGFLIKNSTHIGFTTLQAYSATRVIASILGAPIRLPSGSIPVALDVNFSLRAVRCFDIDPSDDNNLFTRSADFYGFTITLEEVNAIPDFDEEDVLNSLLTSTNPSAVFCNPVPKVIFMAHVPVTKDDAEDGLTGGMDGVIFRRVRLHPFAKTSAGNLPNLTPNVVIRPPTGWRVRPGAKLILRVGCYGDEEANSPFFLIHSAAVTYRYGELTC